jgi:hypothetical protein
MIPHSIGRDQRAPHGHACTPCPEILPADAHGIFRYVEQVRPQVETLGWTLVTYHGVLNGKGLCSRCLKHNAGLLPEGCGSPGKRPWLEEWQHRPRPGLRDLHGQAYHYATDRRCVGRGCFGDIAPGPGPHLPNVGVHLGASGLVVLDVDGRHGGNESLARLLAEHGTLPPTAEDRSGSDHGGGHHYFRAPADGVLPTVSTVTIAPGIELLAGLKAVVIPPSMHAHGRRYTWLVDPVTTPPAELPQWIVDLAWTAYRQGKTAKEVNGRCPATAQPAANHRNGTPRARDNVHAGRHNFLLPKLARHRARGATDSDIVALAASLNATRCVPPLPDDEVAGIVRWVQSKPVGNLRWRLPEEQAEWDAIHAEIEAERRQPQPPSSPMTEADLADLARVKNVVIAERQAAGLDPYPVPHIPPTSPLSEATAKALENQELRRNMMLCEHPRDVLRDFLPRSELHVTTFRCERRGRCYDCTRYLNEREIRNALRHFCSACKAAGSAIAVVEYAAEEWPDVWDIIHRQDNPNYLQWRGENDRERRLAFFVVVGGIVPKGLTPVAVLPPDDAARQELADRLASYTGERRPLTTSQEWRLPKSEGSGDFVTLGIADPSMRDPHTLRDVAKAAEHTLELRVTRSREHILQDLVLVPNSNIAVLGRERLIGAITTGEPALATMTVRAKECVSRGPPDEPDDPVYPHGDPWGDDIPP